MPEFRPQDVDPGSLGLLILLASLCLGLALGGFLTVVLTRLADPATRGWVASFRAVSQPAVSHCPTCSHPLAWRDKLALLGWFINRGRCRFCSIKISVFYPLTEGAGAAFPALLVVNQEAPDAKLLALGVALVLQAFGAWIWIRIARRARHASSDPRRPDGAEPC